MKTKLYVDEKARRQAWRDERYQTAILERAAKAEKDEREKHTPKKLRNPRLAVGMAAALLALGSDGEGGVRL
jgi:hypothetical protein